MRKFLRCFVYICSFVLVSFSNPIQAESSGDVIIDSFITLLIAQEKSDRDAAYYVIDKKWESSFIPMVLEAMHLSPNPQTTQQLIKLLEEKTGESYGRNINAWYEWLWNQEEQKYKHYAKFKAELYQLIDPKFYKYFEDSRISKIRLDEVRWGGVLQDGIPPLRYPEMIKAEQADYLEDSNIVFGLSVNGDARAYPKRILAWHEMFVDDVGGVPVAGVYCTLCGTMILYKTEFDGINHKLGTSGFLYRSNKLMYDEATQSLWNTIWGTPAIGPLVDKNIELERMSVVTTTWKEWKKRHPDTVVLSLDTGYSRDYGEGVAYNEYFATDELMFNVPKLDNRLKNKDEVLALIFSQYPEEPLAISAAYLMDHPVYSDTVGDVEFVVLTDSSGANRVYESKGIKFTDWDKQFTVTDDSGGKWKVTEDILEGEDGKKLYRLPAHRAFWFGWFSAYPNSKLIM